MIVSQNDKVAVTLTSDLINKQADKIGGTGEAVSNVTTSALDNTIAPIRFEISINDTIVNKDKNALKTAKYRRVATDIRGLMRHVAIHGKMFAVGVYRNNHRHEHDFIQSQVICLDFDQKKDANGVGVTGHSTASLLAHPLIAQYGSYYATASYTDTAPCHRVIFVLDKPITDVTVYRDLVSRLITALRPSFEYLDTSTKDGARNWFGHKMSADDEGVLWGVNTNALPVATLEALPKADTHHHAPTPKRAQAVKVNMSAIDTQSAETLIKALPQSLKRVIDDLLSVSHGNRNNRLFKATVYILGQWRKVHKDQKTAETTIMTVMKYCGLKIGLPADEVTACLLSAGKYDAKPSVSPDDTDLSWLNSHEPKLDFRQGNLITLDVQFMNQADDERLAYMLAHRLVTIQSATGTGKTEFIKTVISHLEHKLGRKIRVLVVTYRRSLVFQNSARLGFLSYQDEYSFADSTVTTLDSLHHFASQKYDLIVIDEFNQCLHHLAKSGTLRGDRLTPLDTLKTMMSNARQTLAMDASATHTGAVWLESVNTAHQKSHIRVSNIFLPKHRTLEIYRHRDSFLADVMESASKGFTTLACASLRDAEIACAIAESMGLSVLLVTSNTSSNEDVRNGVNNINTIEGKNLLIYTPSLGVGVDITRKVIGAYLWAGGTHLTSQDYIQMLSRARHADVYRAFGVRLPKGKQSADTLQTPTAPVLLDDVVKMARASTGDLEDTLTGARMESAKLWSMLRADELHDLADEWSFVSSARANGFEFGAQHTDENVAMKQLIKTMSMARDEELKDLTLNTPAVTDEELETSRKNGVMTKELRAGNTRYKIENMTGLSISDGLYEQLGTSKKRVQIRNLAYALANSDDVHRLDRAINNGKAWQDIHAIHAQYEIFWGLMLAMGMSDITDLRGIIGARKDEIVTDSVMRFLERKHGDIRRAFKRYNQTDNPFTELKAVLRHFGIEWLKPKRVMRDGERYYTYTIDASALNSRVELATVVLAQLIAQNVSRYSLIKNGQIPPRTHTHANGRGEGGVKRVPMRVKNPFSAGISA